MNKVLLSDFIDKTGDGIHGTPTYAENGTYYFINGNNLRNGRIVIDADTLMISDDEFENIKRPLNENTILISINGTIGNLAYYNGEKIALGKSACYINVKSTENKYFIHYILSTKEFHKYALQVAHGSTIKNLAPSQIAEYSFLAPSASNRDKIANVLKSLDDKIDNNTSIMGELEAMTKTLYDYWFVQFDFPDENGKPYRTSGGEMVWNDQLKRAIPKGWTVKHIVDAYNVCYGYPFDTEQFTASDTGNPVIRIRDILEATTSARTLEQVDAKYWVSSGDLLVGMDGNFHMNFWNGKPALLNQRCFKVSTTSFSTLIAYFASMPYIKAREKNVTRTTVGHLSADDVKALQVLYPDDKIREKISSSFDSILTKMCSLKEENRELTKLRDWLLPMLMNGQATVE